MAISNSLDQRQIQSYVESVSVANVPAVRVVNPDGTDIAGGGGGTQYTEGDTDATITGTAIMWEDAGNALTPVSSAKPLPVDLGANNDINVSQLGGQNIDLGAGAVGTGTQRTILASDDPAVVALQVIDDWDESDRAKVNVIAGQSGVDGGAGVVSAATQRTTLASDDPLVASAGSSSDAAATAGSTGTLQAKLRLVTFQLDSIKTAVETLDNIVSGTAAQITGTIAHDAADSGNPIKVGFKAKSFDGTEPGTAVAEDDRVDSIADPYGRQYVNDMHPRFWHVSSDYASAQTNTSVKAAPGASLKLYITDIAISNGATAGNVTLLDGSGGTVLFECYPGVNGGIVANLKHPIALTSNTALCVTSTTVTTHSVNISGFIAP